MRNLVGLGVGLFVLCLCREAVAGEECVNLAYALIDCNVYKCTAQFASDSVEYKVWGMSNGKCRYTEMDQSGVMSCNIAKDNLGAVSNYFVQLLTKSGNLDAKKIADFRARECNFYAVSKGASITGAKGGIAKYGAVSSGHEEGDLRVRKALVQELGSVFFREEDVKNLAAKLGEEQI